MILPKDGGFEWRIEYGNYTESGWCETEEQARRVANWAWQQLYRSVHPRNIWSLEP